MDEFVFVFIVFLSLFRREYGVEEMALAVECDLEKLEEFRNIWPFFRDRRIDSYDPILKRWID